MTDFLRADELLESSPAVATTRDKHIALLFSVFEQGATLGPLRPEDQGHAGYGLVATEALLPGTLLCRIPLNQSLTAGGQQEAPLNPLAEATSPTSPIYPRPTTNPHLAFEQLAGQLLCEKAKGPESPFWSYIQVLPAEVPSLVGSFPEEARQYFGGAVGEKTASYAMNWPEKAAERLKGTLDGDFTTQEVRWALSVVVSRALLCAPQGGKAFLALIPIGDLFNHAPAPTPEKVVSEQQSLKPFYSDYFRTHNDVGLPKSPAPDEAGQNSPSTLEEPMAAPVPEKPTPRPFFQDMFPCLTEVSFQAPGNTHKAVAAKKIPPHSFPDYFKHAEPEKSLVAGPASKKPHLPSYSQQFGESTALGESTGWAPAQASSKLEHPQCKSARANVSYTVEVDGGERFVVFRTTAAVTLGQELFLCYGELLPRPLCTQELFALYGFVPEAQGPISVELSPSLEEALTSAWLQYEGPYPWDLNEGSDEKEHTLETRAWDTAARAKAKELEEACLQELAAKTVEGGDYLPPELLPLSCCYLKAHGCGELGLSKHLVTFLVYCAQLRIRKDLSPQQVGVSVEKLDAYITAVAKRMTQLTWASGGAHSIVRDTALLHEYQKALPADCPCYRDYLEERILVKGMANGLVGAKFVADCQLQEERLAREEKALPPPCPHQLTALRLSLQLRRLAETFEAKPDELYHVIRPFYRVNGKVQPAMLSHKLDWLVLSAVLIGGVFHTAGALFEVARPHLFKPRR